MFTETSFFSAAGLRDVQKEIQKFELFYHIDTVAFLQNETHLKDRVSEDDAAEWRFLAELEHALLAQNESIKDRFVSEVDDDEISQDIPSDYAERVAA
jgi:hypothetical protein